MAVITIAVDLRSDFGPVRDQGRRPTCLAFAVSDSHSAVRNELTHLSCEFIFFHAQRRAGRPPTTGALLGPMLQALREDGQPEEVAWPYLVADPDPAAWVPPLINISSFKRHAQPHSATIDSIFTKLTSAQPVIVLTSLADPFYRPKEGVVTLSKGETPKPNRRHAVIAVGSGAVDGRRAILVRNSWGLNWGLGGHAWLDESFLASALLNTVTLQGEA